MDQLHAAQDAVQRLSIAWQYLAGGDERAVEASDALPLLRHAMASFLLASPEQEPALPPAAGAAPAMLAGGASAALASPDDFDEPTCVRATPTAVRYVACTTTARDGWVVRVDGEFTRRGADVSWDLTVLAVLDRPGYAATGRKRLHGDIVIGSVEVTGRAVAEVTTTGVAAGAPFEVGAITVADVDLDHAASEPWCPTAGTLELRRVWTARRSGALTEGWAADQGYRFEWAGCDRVRVAASVDPSR